MKKKKLKKPPNALTNAQIERQLSEMFTTEKESHDVQIIRNTGDKKFSQVLSEFVKPLFELPYNTQEEFLHQIDQAVLIWNKAIADEFPDHSISRKLKVLFPLFLATSKDKKLVKDLLERKRLLFYNEPFFIMHCDATISKGKLKLTVSALQMPE